MLDIYSKLSTGIPKRHILKDVHIVGTDVISGKRVELSASHFDAFSSGYESRIQPPHSMFERKIGFFRPGL